MADRVLLRDTVTGVVTATLDPTTLGGVGIKYHLEATDAIVVPDRFQYLVQGAIIIDFGGSLIADPGGQIVVLP